MRRDKNHQFAQEICSIWMQAHVSKLARFDTKYNQCEQTAHLDDNNPQGGDTWGKKADMSD